MFKSTEKKTTMGVAYRQIINLVIITMLCYILYYFRAGVKLKLKILSDFFYVWCFNFSFMFYYREFQLLHSRYLVEHQRCCIADSVVICWTCSMRCRQMRYHCSHDFRVLIRHVILKGEKIIQWILFVRW